MNFNTLCTATVSKNGTVLVLLKFAGHLMGEIPKEFGELRSGVMYRVTIEEHHGDPAMANHATT
jgi:hypothetical protein